MPAAKLLQAGERISQVMIFDKRCRSIQPIRRAGSEVADGLGTLASGCANPGGNRMERASGPVSRHIQSLTGGPAQMLH
jgi:hypothetical protein